MSNGPWRVDFYQSGTMNVSDGSRGPWLYIYGPGNDNEDQYVRDRYRCCEQVRDYLNGDGPRPTWLDDLTRTREDHAEALDRTSITACGPMVDANPPRLQWVTDKSDEAANARARLMDRLFLPSQADRT